MTPDWVRRGVLPGALGILVVALTACGARDAATPAPAGITELRVAAAASLARVLETAATAYEAANPGVTIVLATDSSAALRTRIEQGAPTDLFLSADLDNPQALVDAGLAAGPVTAFAGNRPTIIVPADNPARIEGAADLARDGVKVIAAGAAVPITRYAELLVGRLGMRDGFPPDYAEAYEANIVSREDNVAAIVAKIALGEGDAGIVYVTDARANPDVAEIPVPAGDGVDATYGAVVTTDAASPEAADAFLDWLTGPDGQAILGSAGFEQVQR